MRFLVLVISLCFLVRPVSGQRSNTIQLDVVMLADSVAGRLQALRDSLPRRAVEEATRTLSQLSAVRELLVQAREQGPRDRARFELFAAQARSAVAALDALLKPSASCHTLQVEQFVAAMRTNGANLQRIAYHQGRTRLLLLGVLARGLRTPNVLPDSVSEVTLIGEDGVWRASAPVVTVHAPGSFDPIAQLKTIRSDVGAPSLLLPRALLDRYRSSCLILRATDANRPPNWTPMDPLAVTLCLPESETQPISVSLYTDRSVQSRDSVSISPWRVEIRHDKCGSALAFDTLTRVNLPPGHSLLRAEISVQTARGLDTAWATVSRDAIRLRGRLTAPQCFRPAAGVVQSQAQTPRVFQASIATLLVYGVSTGSLVVSRVDSGRFFGTWEPEVPICVHTPGLQDQEALTFRATLRGPQRDDQLLARDTLVGVLRIADVLARRDAFWMAPSAAVSTERGLALGNLGSFSAEVFWRGTRGEDATTCVRLRVSPSCRY